MGPIPMLILYHLVLALFYFPGSVSGQNYAVPSGWQNTVSNASRADRLNIAYKAATGIQNRINISMGVPTDASNVTDTTVQPGILGNMVIVLASQDWRSGSNSWKNQVVGNTLPFYESGKEGLGSLIGNIDNGILGLGEITAYLAYNDSFHLSIAKRSFDTIYKDFLSNSAAQSGTYPRALSTSCGPSLGGLLFPYIQTYTNNPVIHAGALGPWIALSARLYELTQNSTYLDAAEQSVRFMQTFMINSSNAVIAGEFDPTSCTIAKLGEANVDDIGPYIEGLSVLANITSNHTYTQIMNDLIPAIVSYPSWHTDSGILRQDTTWCSKGSLFRGLLEARRRNPSNSGLVTLIDSYITVQYNAVRDNAYIGDDSYTVSWHDGNAESQSYSTVGNIEALDVLNAAFVIAPANVSPQPTTSPQPTPNPSDDSRVPIGMIVGATLGGTAAVAAVAVTLIIRLRRRRRAREMPVNDDQIDTNSHPSQRALSRAELIPEPFTLRVPLHHPSTSAPEKGGSQQRDLPAPEPQNIDTTIDPLSDPSVDTGYDTTAAPPRPIASDTDALRALERRLERRFVNLFHTLANHGETESNPPEYDGLVTNRDRDSQEPA